MAARPKKNTGTLGAYKYIETLPGFHALVFGKRQCSDDFPLVSSDFLRRPSAESM